MKYNDKMTGFVTRMEKFNQKMYIYMGDKIGCGSA